MEQNVTEKKITRQQLWEKEYRARRYMQYMTDEELIERGVDVFSNMCTLTKEGKVAPRISDEEGRHWLLLWSEYMFECSMRTWGSNFAPINIRDHPRLKFPDPRSPWVRRAQPLLTDRSLGHSAIVKFGKLEHLKPLRDDGLVRLFPASHYSDPSLGKARTDDELCRVVCRPGRADIHYVTQSWTDYYVWCAARSLDLRLFGDFNDANSCLIIHDKALFSRRMNEAFEQRAGKWAFGGASVGYYDPVDSPPAKVVVFLQKHFRFAYQKEYRLVWIPLKPVDVLPWIDLTVGPLTDCSELISLC